MLLVFACAFNRSCNFGFRDANPELPIRRLLDFLEEFVGTWALVAIKFNKIKLSQIKVRWHCGINLIN
jgi:hypothetical protein